MKNSDQAVSGPSADELSGDPWYVNLDHVLEQFGDQLVHIRRHLHANPEISGEERETSIYLYQMLGDRGLDVHLGPEGRGVVADITSHEAGVRRIGLRADIDALRIHDEKTVGYRSLRDGVMHACGHDAHTAILVGALVGLQELNRRRLLPWPIRVRGIFQPAEETARGAQEMIDVGAVDGVEAILALHVDPTRPVGHIGLRSGVLTANCDEMSIRIVGRGGHAARPHEASDPISTAAQLINAIYVHVPRSTDSQEAVVVTIGKITGGDNANVIPEFVELHGTVRTLDHRVRQQTFQHIRRIAAGVGKATETQITVEYTAGADSVHNDSRLVELLRMAAVGVIGEPHIDRIPRPSMGSEDFAYYLEHVPGAMFRLGTASEQTGREPLHAPNFDIDESALLIGSRLLARAALMWCRPQTGPAPAQLSDVSET